MPGNEEQREGHHRVRAGQITKGKKTHVRQGISFTLGGGYLITPP